MKGLFSEGRLAGGKWGKRLTRRVDHLARRVARERIPHVLLKDADRVWVGACELVDVDVGVEEGGVGRAVKPSDELKRVSLETSRRGQFYAHVCQERGRSQRTPKP